MSLKVAIVGAGPAGFYAAEALASADETVHVDLIDRLPTPHGLIRSGVAPDHQKTKNVTRKYDQTASRDNVRYVGNVMLGRDVSVAELKEIYDAVIIAFGAEGDRPLGVPGEDKEGVYGSFAFVGWYNGHPDFVDLDPDLNTESAVVVGNGNVALDCARLLARTANEMKASDVFEDAGEAMYNSPIRDIYILGRRGPVEASFSIAEMREMGELEQGVSVVHDDQIPEELPEDMDAREARSRKPVLEVLKSFRQNRSGTKPKTVHFEFFLRPVEVLGDDRVTGIRVERTRLENGRAIGTGEIFDIPCGIVITCIGYVSREVEGLPMEWGKIVNEDGRVGPGVYCVGWAKRGPTGTIGTNRPDAQDVARLVIEDLGQGAGKPGGAALDTLLQDRGLRHTDYEDWMKIDEAEQANAPEAAPRRKFVTIPDMLAIVDEA
ncbi:FAD-dependent oxidoreductase [Minwuia thermotolerans]|uniref:Pyridine nucleotide-disulfide oxidoreductase n=1 Tax=Minwuia thermotolerans TaxID=2056226 RepID=A0A2M9G7D4_9PROT|nr:FAD-dependent oxidoreductase [Minwuia thermotolerans]PJK31629.1 pyridine nucleotide-disulfide oxidoreductase [Minwuia thermotolerans]